MADESTEHRDAAVRAVDRIISDQCDRSGGDWFWDGIDDETAAEIRETWAAIVREEASR